MARTNPPYYEDEDETLAEEVEETNALGGFGSKINGLNPDTEEEDNSILGGGNPYAVTEPDYTYDATNPKAWSAGDDFDSALNYLLNPNQEEQQTIAPTTIAMPNRIGELQGKVDEAKAKREEAVATQKQTLQDMVNLYATQAEEIKPRFTQEELDSRRAKSTNLSMLTSALANLANGIAVGKGAINATVPDGYQAAYQHWNDVQQRQDKRKAEYDKLMQAVLEKRGKIADLDYAVAEGEYKEANARLVAEEERVFKREMQAAKTAEEEAKAKRRHEDRLAEIAAQGEENRKTKKTKGAGTSGSGGGGSKSSGSLEDYRSFGNVTIPSGVSIPDAYSKMADAAIAHLNTKLRGSDVLDKDIKDMIKKISGKKTMVGTNAEKRAKIKALIEAFGEAGIDDEILQEALNGMQPSQPAPQPRKKNSQSNSNSGNGGTGSNNAADIFG